MIDDPELLRRYVEERSEVAFATLVERHLGFVYAAALRQLNGATHRAEEVAQAVFIDLARKAGVLSRRTELAGWLYTSTHYAAAKLKRTEQRRQQREQEAHAMNEILSDDGAPANWERVRPVLDDAMQRLGEEDRSAILLRYFQGRRFAEVGERLGLSEDGARMRVDRALDKLRVLLARRQITSTTAALGAVLASQPVVAVPAGLAASVTGAAVAGSAGVTVGTAFFVFMKAKTTLLTAAALLALGGAFYQTRQAQAERTATTAVARERDELRAKLRDAQQQIAAAEQRTVALQREAETARAQKSFSSFAPPPALVPPSGSTVGVVTARPEIPGSPEAQQRRVRSGDTVDNNYAALYRQLNWTPEQRTQFRNLMLDGTDSAERLFHAARAKNPGLDRIGLLDLFEATQAQMLVDQVAEVRRVFGDAASEAMAEYRASLPVRTIANQLAAALFNSSNTLSATQADQLVGIMARNARTSSGAVDVASLDTDAAVEQAQGLLTPAQLVEFRRVASRAQEEKKAAAARKAESDAAVKAAGK